MTDLRPILQDDPTESEARLLSSARLDGPPASGKGRLIAALGVAAVTTTAAGTGAATAGVSLAVKWLAVGALGSAITFGAVEVMAPAAHRSAASPGRSEMGVPVPSPAARRVVPHLDAIPAPTTPPIPDPVPESLSVEPAPPTEAPRRAPVLRDAKRPVLDVPSAALPAPSASSALPKLTRELLALDGARRALASRDAEAALRLLDAYAGQFAEPVLTPEATVLRIECLLALGRDAEARAIAGRLLAEQPDIPYAQRLRTLVSVTPSQTP